MKRKITLIMFAISAWIIFSSWGYTGHLKIGEGASQYFDPSMSQFHDWTQFISEHSADADKRKSWDDDEAIKHYIDIDNYNEFIETGYISQNKDTLITLYGSSFVDKQGTLPWTTLETYDSLVSCFSRLDFENALIFTADLSHYVADGHMPLHLTKNYNGQDTNNKGIHSQYESGMIGKYVNQIEIKGGEVNQIENVSEYVFNYLYASYPYVDSILLADTYARTINSNTASSAYHQAMWDKTQVITNQLFEQASMSLANLIYTAWISAGSPLLNTELFTPRINNVNFVIEAVYVDRKDSSLNFEYQLDKDMDIEFNIINTEGKLLLSEPILDGNIGTHQYKFDISKFSKGIYIFVMNGEKQILTHKFTVK